MSRIISVSRRTDVPAFYGPWFMRRIQEGFAGVVTPYGGKRYLVSLAPQDVDCFVFWSKDFTPFVPHLDTLDRLGYRFYFNYTLTALPAVFETNVDKAAALKTLQYLSERYSPRHINWRFDPIILSNITGADFYLDHFERLAAQLAGRVERCYFSFVTEYEKVKRNLFPLLADQGIRLLQPHPEEKIALADRLAAIADRYGIRHVLLLRRLPAGSPDSQGSLHRWGAHRAVVLSAGVRVQREAHAQGMRLHREHRHRHLRHLPARLSLLLRQRQQGRGRRGLPAARSRFRVPGLR